VRTLANDWKAKTTARFHLECAISHPFCVPCQRKASGRKCVLLFFVVPTSFRHIVARTHAPCVLFVCFCSSCEPLLRAATRLDDERRLPLPALAGAEKQIVDGIGLRAQVEKVCA